MTTSLDTGKPAATPHGATRGGAHARHFPVPTAELERIAAAVLAAARSGGATAAETEVSQGIGQSVTVRATLKNMGTVAAQNLQVVLKRGDEVLSTRSKTSLAPGDHYAASFAWTSAASGPWPASSSTGRTSGCSTALPSAWMRPSRASGWR